MSDDNGVDVNQPMPSGSRHNFLLSCGDHAVKIFDLVLEHFYELDHSSVADVQSTIELKNARVSFRIKIQLGDILAADEHRSILIVRIDRRDNADTDTRALGKLDSGHRKLFVLSGILVL